MMNCLTAFLPSTLLTIGLTAAPAAAMDNMFKTSSTVSITEIDDQTTVESTVIIVDDGGETVKITRRNNDIAVQIEGKDVPPDRLKREGNRLTILDEDGSERLVVRLLPGGGIVVGDEAMRDRFRAHVMPPSGPGAPGRARLRVPGGPNMPGAGAPVPGGSVMPRGRIGITLGAIDSALAEHLKLNPDEVVLITGVRQGAPADEAGLQQHDIIIKVEGKSPVTYEIIQDAVRAKEPGEIVSLTILRGGKQQEFEVEVAPVEANELAIRLEEDIAREGEWSRWMRPFLGRGGSAPRWRERVRELLSDEQIEKLRKQLLEDIESAFEIEIDEETREKLQRIAQRAAARAAELRQQLMADAEDIAEHFDFEFEFESVPGIQFFRNDGETKGMIVSPPDAPTPPRAENRRLRRELQTLEERLERIERLMEELLERQSGEE